MGTFTPIKEEYKGYKITQFTHAATLHDYKDNHIETFDDVFQARNYIDKLLTQK